MFIQDTHVSGTWKKHEKTSPQQKTRVVLLALAPEVPVIDGIVTWLVASAAGLPSSHLSAAPGSS